jgi:hypothetical protein
MKPGSFLTPALDSYALLLQEPGLSVEPRASVWLRSSDPVKKVAGAIASLDAAGVEQYLGRQAWFGGYPRAEFFEHLRFMFHLFRFEGNRRLLCAPTHCHWKECRNYRHRGYLFAGDKTGNYTFFIFPIYSNAILVTVICTSGFRADLLISAIRRSEVGAPGCPSPTSGACQANRSA